MTFTPDNWIILKITKKDEVFYKILAGCSGGYLYGNSWRMNSGISKVRKSGDYYLFFGYSGSVYRCHKDAEMLRMNNVNIYRELLETYPDIVSKIDYVDFIKEYCEK